MIFLAIFILPPASYPILSFQEDGCFGKISVMNVRTKKESSPIPITCASNFSDTKAQTNAATSAKLNLTPPHISFCAGPKNFVRAVNASLYFCVKSHTIAQHIIQKVEK